MLDVNTGQLKHFPSWVTQGKNSVREIVSCLIVLHVGTIISVIVTARQKNSINKFQIVWPIWTELGLTNMPQSVLIHHITGSEVAVDTYSVICINYI